MNQTLLVIDVQRGLMDGPTRPYEADAVVERINSLTARAREAGVPVVFIQHEDAELVFGSEDWQLAENLLSSDSDVVIRKTTCDSFLRTNLGAILKAAGTEKLVICGYSTEYCVDTTVRSALGAGYPVILVADAHTSHDKDHASGKLIRAHHNATLSSIGSFGVRTKAVPTAQVVFE